MPGISPDISHCTYRPSSIGLMVVVDSDFTGWAPGYIHKVFFPCHVPTLLARCSCILPSVAAAMHACMSACVHPGGSCISGCWPAAAAAAAGLASFDGSATATGTTIVATPTATINDMTTSMFRFIANLPGVNGPRHTRADRACWVSSMTDGLVADARARGSPARDRADDEERLLAARDARGQRLVRRVVREVFLAGEEPHE